MWYTNNTFLLIRETKVGWIVKLCFFLFVLIFWIFWDRSMWLGVVHESYTWGIKEWANYNLWSISLLSLFLNCHKKDGISTLLSWWNRILLLLLLRWNHYRFPTISTLFRLLDDAIKEQVQLLGLFNKENLLRGKGMIHIIWLDKWYLVSSLCDTYYWKVVLHTPRFNEARDMDSTRLK